MVERNLLKSATQTFWVILGDTSFQVYVYTFHDLMYVDVSQNGEDRIVTGQRVIQNKWILPEYLSSKYGNFRFETYDSDAEEYVCYTGFNSKFRFCQYSASELS